MDVNLLAIFASAVLYMFVGCFWYSPALFGNIWMKAMGLSEEDKKNKATAFAGATANALVMSYVLVKLSTHLGVSDIVSGATLAFWLWLGFILTCHFSAVLWAKKSIKVFLIDVSCMFVTLLLMGSAVGLLS